MLRNSAGCSAMCCARWLSYKLPDRLLTFLTSGVALVRGGNGERRQKSKGKKQKAKMEKWETKGLLRISL